MPRWSEVVPAQYTGTAGQRLPWKRSNKQQQRHSMARRQVQGGLLLSVLLQLCWHAQPSSAAPLTSEQSSSLTRSWQGARAAAKAARERNLHLAGVTGTATAANAAHAVGHEATAATPAGAQAAGAMQHATASATVADDPVDSVAWADDGTAVQAGLAATRQVQQLEDAVEQLASAVQQQTRTEQRQQEQQQDKEVNIGYDQYKRQPIRDSTCALNLLQEVTAGAATTEAVASAGGLSSGPAMCSSKQHLKQLETAVYRLEESVHQSKMLLEQREKSADNRPMTAGMPVPSGQAGQSTKWGISSTFQARASAVASALAASAAAGRKQVIAAAVAGQAKLAAGMSELQQKLPDAVLVVSSKEIQQEPPALSCAATQQEVQELRIFVQQLEAKLSQQQQMLQQQAGHMLLLLCPCLVLLGWLLHGFAAPQMPSQAPPAAAAVANNCGVQQISAAEKAQTAAAAVVLSKCQHGATDGSAKWQLHPEGQHLQEQQQQQHAGSALSSNSSGGGRTTVACSRAAHAAEAPAGEQQERAQDKHQPAALNASVQSSTETASAPETHASAPAGEAALQQQNSVTFSRNQCRKEFAEASLADEQPYPLCSSSSSDGHSSGGGRKSRRVSLSAGRRSTRVTSQSGSSNAIVARLQQTGASQQGAIIVACSEETMTTIIQPAVRVLMQLSQGVHGLLHMADAVVHNLSQVTSAGTRLATQVEQLLSFGTKQEKDKRLAAQQALGERSGQLGFALLLLAVGAAALKVGRFWEVHEVCSGGSLRQAGSWIGRMTGASIANHAWQYTACCVHQLGLYAVGLVVLYQLAMVTWRGLLGGNNHPAKCSWQLDLVVFRGVVCSMVGVHVLHCLGAAWVPWLLLWLVWVGSQVLLQVKQLSMACSAVMVLTVAVLLPLLMAVAPFHTQGVLLQGWLLQAMPWLEYLMLIPNLVGLQW